MKNTLKIVIAGEGAVGKTTLISRLTQSYNASIPPSMTPGLDVQKLQFNEFGVNGQVWDLGGQEHFRFFQSPFFKGAEIVLLVYSVEWYHSFLQIEHWYNLIIHETQPMFILVANKIDTNDRAVSTKEGMALATRYNWEYLETSAKNAEGVATIEKLLNNYIRVNFLSKDLSIHQGSKVITHK